MKFSFFLIIIVLIGSCVDRIDIAIPGGSANQLVVDGQITDEPGPYTVKLTFASGVNDVYEFTRPFTAKRVMIFDDAGNQEELKLIENGIYQTKPDGIRGVIGRSYSLHIETLNGKVYESIPDIMNPVGKVDSLYYEYNIFKPIDKPTEYGINVFIDAQGVPESENLFRWTLTGTFETYSFPEKHRVPCTSPCGCLAPLSCAFVSAGCTCCHCWVTEHEAQPHVSDNQFVRDGIFRNINLGRIPLGYFSFQYKYRVEVKQMSLSRTAFEYWKIIQSQKEGATSLFQPSFGKARTNIFEKNGADEVLGIFYASAVTNKQLYLTNKDVSQIWKNVQIPVLWCEIGIMPDDCRAAYPFSSTTKPDDWN